MRSIALVASGLFVLGSLVACGGNDGSSSGTGGAGGAGSTTSGEGAAGTTSQGGSGGSAPECEPPASNPGASNDVPVSMVTAIARDDSGEAIANTKLQLCGTDNCLFADTNDFGQAVFTSTVGTLDRPMFKPNDSLEFGKIGYPYLETSPDSLPGFFPRMVDSGSAVEAGAEVSAAGVTVAIPAGGAVVIDDLIYDEPAKQTFRAAQLPEEQRAMVPELADFAAVFTLGPIDTLFCPPAKVTVPNPGLPADAAVEIFAQELAVAEDFGPYGQWSKIADGVVSSDGATISTTDASGLPALLTIAIKPAP